MNVADPAEHTDGTSGVNARVLSVLDEMRAEAEQCLLEVLERSTLASVLERNGYTNVMHYAGGLAD